MYQKFMENSLLAKLFSPIQYPEIILTHFPKGFFNFHLICSVINLQEFVVISFLSEIETSVAS